MRKFESAADVQAHWNYIDKYANDDGRTSFWMQQQMYRSDYKRLSAIASWRDLSPELQGSNKSVLNNKIFDILFDYSAPLQWGDKHDENERNAVFDNLREGGFSSQFESGPRKNSFGHLIEALANHPHFHDLGYQGVADLLNEPYVTYDGGADINMVFKKSDLKARNMTVDDMYENANYAMIRAIKENKHLTFEILAEHENLQKEMGGEPHHQLTKLAELKKKLLDNDEDASIWTATRPSQDGKGMEVVLMTGDMHDRDKRTAVARWMYKDKAKDGRNVLSILKYEGDEKFKVLSAYQRGNFMDIDNDEDIKTNVKRWIDEGASAVVDKIPGGLEEVAVHSWWPWKIGKFEWYQVVKPFWDKNKHLSKEKFAEEWERVRLQETYAFEQKYFDLHFNGLIDLFTPDVVPFRHGAGSYSKQGSLGGRSRSRGKPRGLLFKAKPTVVGGEYSRERQGILSPAEQILRDQ
jgi:hypothetical protein